MGTSTNEPLEKVAQRVSSADFPASDHALASSSTSELLARLQHSVDHAAHLLPSQGPITVFIHHNTLHAFEELSFTDAVELGAKTFGCQPYLSEDRYREELGRGRISFADVVSVLMQDLGAGANEKLPRLCTRVELRLAMLQYPLRFGPTEELLWFVAETDALRKVRGDVSAATRARLIAETRRWVMRDLRVSSENGNGSHHPHREAGTVIELLERFDEPWMEGWSEQVWEAFTLQALWRVCCDGVKTTPESVAPVPAPERHRDLLFKATGADSDLLVNDLLIRFCGAFFDQGLSNWQLPERDQGFYRAFCALYQEPASPPGRWAKGLAAALSRLEREGITPIESIRESLEILGVEEQEWDSYLSATLLALRGWGGITHVLEERGDRVVQPIQPGSLTEMLAIRLVLDRLAIEHSARVAGVFEESLSSLRGELQRKIGPPKLPSIEQRAFPVFQLAQVLGWTPEELQRLNAEEWSRLVEEIDVFSGIERRRVFHLAYELRFYTQTLDAYALHERWPENKSPRFQAMFCIDDREESLRRHVEELEPNCVTYGIAGFYFVGMYFKGAADAHFVPLCPVIMVPQNWVVEKVLDNSDGHYKRGVRTRRVLGRASHHVHLGSRTFALGAFLSAVGGVLASIPLIARTFFPRLTAQIKKVLGGLVVPNPLTRLQVEETSPTPPTDGKRAFNLDEMTASAARVLQDTGLTSGFSRLVLTIGHGSSSVNNPHRSAYDCGACGGAPGAPNGRAISQILNDPRIRQRLKERGLVVPDDTVFVGGFHNTGNDAVTFFDLDLIPESHRQEFAEVRAIMEKACERDAHERCRRFLNTPLTMSFSAAKQQVEGRTEDLAQVRPELGHATNAITYVGRRSRTRGLFLDRRAFLNSYDPTQDDEKCTILTRILMAAVPVCSGINLEYYFSYVDNAGFGSGTKLSHNVGSLLGVMDGATSDLRTGLPWQMVEIHEPVRCLFIIETTPEKMTAIMDAQPGIGRMIRNDWVKLALLDTHSQGILMYDRGEFREYKPQAKQLPKARSSVNWYRGWRDHLEFAEIGEPGSVEKS